MSVPRIARIHLVYQFIILTLIIFAISYIEILPDKKIWFLTLIPVFAYQLLIIFICSEVVPIPVWLSWTETENEALNNQEKPADNIEEVTCSSEKSKSSEEYESPTIPRARLFTKNKETPDSVTSNDNEQNQNVSDIFNRAPVTSKITVRRAESTKFYGLKRSNEDRLEDLELEDVQPYLARNWRSLQDQKCKKSRSNAVEYFGPSIINRRRKSVSTEAIDRELKQINSHFEQNATNDFTKSMEVPKESNIEPVAVKKGLKHSASFNKWKQGVSSYFNKSKRGNIDVDNKENDGNRKPFYKELFLSNDIFCQEKGKEAITKTKSSPFPKFQNGVKFEYHSPSYISYNDNF